MGMSDRIVVIAHGQVAGELSREKFDQDTIMQMAFLVKERAV